MKSGPLLEKSYAFSVSIIHCCRTIQNAHREYILTKQLFRSATSVGANIEEASQAQSKKDFASKLAIALKEAHESRYWLRLLRDTHYCSPVEIDGHLKAIHEIIKLLVASINTVKQSI